MLFLSSLEWGLEMFFMVKYNGALESISSGAYILMSSHQNPSLLIPDSYVFHSRYYHASAR